MMNTFDRLDEVRDIARARAMEDFEYFANYVMGARLPTDYCVAAQRFLDLEEPLQIFPLSQRELKDAANAMAAWMVLTGRQGDLPFVRSETYTWLFGEQREAA